MTGSRRLAVLIGLVALAGAAAAVAFAIPFARSAPHSKTTAIGPRMMNGYRSGTMGAPYGSANANSSTSPNSLSSVRTQVESWLRSRGFSGFRVSEVMAFTNNDYVAVRDAKGQPAFELLTARGSGWLMEEPASMMWNAKYGAMHGSGRGWSGMGSMMGGSYGGDWNSWYRTGHGRVSTIAEATTIANRWLAQARSGERVDADVGGMGHFPGYYTLDTTHNGKTVGMLSVNAATGAVWYHGWHGRFLAEREF